MADIDEIKANETIEEFEKEFGKVIFLYYNFKYCQWRHSSVEFCKERLRNSHNKLYKKNTTDF